MSSQETRTYSLYFYPSKEAWIFTASAVVVGTYEQAKQKALETMKANGTATCSILSARKGGRKVGEVSL